MSSGKSFDDAPGSLDRLRTIRRRWPRIGAALRARHRIDREWDIPYLGGASTDGTTVYIDRRLPLVVNDVPITEFFEAHEITEWAIMREFCERVGVELNSGVATRFYERAHHLATAAEDQALRLRNYSWDQYQKPLEELYSPIEHESVQRCPPDLALYPYTGGLRAVVKRAMAKQRLAKRDVNYTYGLPQRQCGLCSMYLPRTKRCTLVEGLIDAAMVCAKFERKP